MSHAGLRAAVAVAWITAACGHHRGGDAPGLSASRILGGYGAGKLTATEVVGAALARVEKYEPAYNAFTFVNPDALAQARRVDELRRQGKKLGPLAGVPVVTKETMDVRGFPSTAGWSRLSSRTGGIDLFPAQNATVVQRLIDAGAIIIGKTNVPAFSNDGTRAGSSWAGPTYNAIDRALVPGASSAGTATAIAAGFAPIGLGEETAGSIQNPAAAQSLVGVKPTFGLVPSRGLVPLAGSTRDVAGPLAATVRDAAIVLDVIAGTAPDEPRTADADAHRPAGGYTSLLSEGALKGRRIGLYGPGWKAAPLSPETAALYQRATVELEALGAVVVADPFAGTGFAALALTGVPFDFRGAETMAYDLSQYFKGLGVPSLAALKERLGVSPFDKEAPLGWYVDAIPALKASLEDPDRLPDLGEFQRASGQYLAIFDAVLASHDLDALVFPHATEVIPALAQTEAVISETAVSAINIAGLPLVTVPGGRYASGAPFALVFVGPLWSEARLLGFAYAYEQATHHRIIPELFAK